MQKQKICQNKEEIKSDFQEQVNKLTSYVPVDYSSMPIIRQLKELPNWADFMSNSRQECFKREAKALRTKKAPKMPFIDTRKLEHETFFEFSKHCYSLLEKVERTLDNKVNEDAISKRIFQKIYNETLETNDMMDNLLIYYKKSNNIITACLRFDKYLKGINCDHLITIS